MKKFLMLISTVLALLPILAHAFSFPEIGFCPLGGPPGWFNRISGEHRRHYYAPPPMMPSQHYPAMAPYGWRRSAPEFSPYPAPPPSFR